MSRPSQSFTAVGDESADHLLQNMVESLRQELQFCPAGTGIFMGGSYGRGDGGVQTDRSGTRLYNDLDFFVFLPEWRLPQKRQLDRRLREIADSWRSRLGIDVDFSSAKGRLELFRHGRRLMYQELKHGHVTILDDGGWMDCIPEIQPSELPFAEACRLMLNRGTGLLLAEEELRSSHAPDCDFILRNFNKLILGCGDALLIAAGKYRWKRPERLRILAELLPPERLDLLRKASAFKARPDRILPEDPRKTCRILRSLFLDTLQTIAGVPPDAGKVLPALALRCRKQGETGLVHWLNWCIGTGRPDFSRDSSLPPVVRLLALLHSHLLASDRLPLPIPAELLRGWQRFN